MIHSQTAPSPRLWQRWLLVVAWMVMIFVLSHMTGSSSSDKSQLLVDFLLWLGIDPNVVPLEVMSFIVRKSAHFTEYLLLAVFSLPLFYHYIGNKSRYWWLTWAFCVLYAASDEWHQSFIPGRTAKVTDVMIDAVGAGLGIWWANRRLTKRHQE